jgi:hypothetical protein
LEATDFRNERGLSDQMGEVPLSSDCGAVFWFFVVWVDFSEYLTRWKDFVFLCLGEGGIARCIVANDEL